MKVFDLAVIGGGPAGLACAATAASGGTAALIEAMPMPGRKLLTSGNGRCNLTNTSSVDAFRRSFGAKARFVSPALHNFTPSGWRELLARHGVKTCAEDGFHVFPEDGRARSVLQAMLSEAASHGVEIFCDRRVTDIRRDKDIFRLHCADSSQFSCRRVALTAGGRSRPELGSRGDGNTLAMQLGHRITPCAPALVGLHASPEWVHSLSGIVLPDAEAGFACGEEAGTLLDRGELLFTRNGFSGPAILDLSGAAALAYGRGEKVTLLIRFRGGENTEAWLEFFNAARISGGKKTLRNTLAQRLPQQLAAALLDNNGFDSGCIMARFSAIEARRLAGILAAARFAMTGSDGFAKAMATTGGVSLDEVDPRTMMSRIVPGLFFAGETLDIDGRCGGYNIQWAVSSGVLAGQSSLSVSSNS